MSPRLRGTSPWRLRLDNATRRRVVPHLAARSFGLAAEAAGDGVRETGRNAQGVILINMRENETLSGIAPVVGEEEDENATSEG